MFLRKVKSLNVSCKAEADLSNVFFPDHKNEVIYINSMAFGFRQVFISFTLAREY